MRENAIKRIYKTIDSGTAKDKLTHLPVFPKIIEFEITNHCNFSCIMCPTGNGSARRERGYMDDVVFEKVINELAKYDVALKFVGQGEPLLHPRAIEYISMAHNSGIVTHLTTNGSLLSEEVINKIIDEQMLDSIKFSFQGIDAKGYYLLRQKDGFDELMDKIRLFYDVRRDKEKPFMTIGTSITDESKEQIESFIDLASKICDKVEVGLTQLTSEDLSLIKDPLDRNRLMELQINQQNNKKRYICCPQVFDVITIRWNGDVSACCGDVHGEMTLGNVLNDSIKDCWTCKKENIYRELLTDGRYNDINACKECYDVYGWTYGNN